jgi:hypothetical protein
MTYYCTMIFDYAGILQLVPATISGQIISQQAGIPVCGAHVYIRPGREEVITGQSGQYRLLTWQPLPVLLTIEHSQYASITVVITEAAGAQTIQLQPIL